MTERTGQGEPPGTPEGADGRDGGSGAACGDGRDVGSGAASGDRRDWGPVDGGVRPAGVLRADGGTSGGLFATVPDPAVKFDIDEGAPTVVAVNDAYARAFDVDRDAGGPLEERLRADLLRSEPGEGFAQIEDVVELVEAAAADDQVTTTVRTRTDVGVRDYLARVVQTDRDDDALAGYVLLTDITAQRERTREIIEERDRLDEFASIVSHDLRNPLEVAKIQMEAARNRGDDVHFEKVNDAHERMERIIEDVLTLARQGQVIDDVGEATLSLVARDAWDSVSAPRSSLTVERDARLEADADRLQELLENLFRNAVEHGGPTATLTVGRTTDGFYVADDGPGIPEEDAERVFEGGFSTSADGTGLGLVIVERIAEAHGWEVAVGEGEDGGARFDFTGVVVRS